MICFHESLEFIQGRDKEEDVPEADMLEEAELMAAGLNSGAYDEAAWGSREADEDEAFILHSL